MPAFSTFKTTNPAYWRYVGSIPAWILATPTNVWDSLMDAIANAVATFVPYSPAGVTTPITVTASPFTYTAGSQPEVIYISGGSITSVTRHTQPLTVSAGSITVLLPPGGSVTVTYASAGSPPVGKPTMIKDY